MSHPAFLKQQFVKTGRPLQARTEARVRAEAALEAGRWLVLAQWPHKRVSPFCWKQWGLSSPRTPLKGFEGDRTSLRKMRDDSCQLLHESSLILIPLANCFRQTLRR